MSIFALAFLVSTSVFAQKDEFEYGKASFYSDKYNGKPTASGELYDVNLMTAAHRTLEFGTIIKVTRLDNKKSVRVKVNDRGPFIPERVVDLSRAAAEKLGIINAGEAKIKLEIVKSLIEKDVAAAKPKEAKKETPKSFEEDSKAVAAKTTEKKATETKKEPAKPVAKETTPKKEEIAKVEKAEPKKVTEKTVKPTSKAALVKGADFQPYDLYKVELLRPEKKGFGVQVASFSQYESVFKQIAELQGEWFKNILMSVEKGEDGKPVYKIILGPFDDQDSANAYKDSLKKKKIKGFVVNLEETEY